MQISKESGAAGDVGTNTLTSVANTSPWGEIVMVERAGRRRVAAPYICRRFRLAQFGSGQTVEDSGVEKDQSHLSVATCRSHGGTGPGEHQPAGPVRVPLRPTQAGLVRSRVHHAEVSAGGRTAQLPLGLPEGRRSDDGPQCGDGEETPAAAAAEFASRLRV